MTAYVIMTTNVSFFFVFFLKEEMKDIMTFFSQHLCLKGSEKTLSNMPDVVEVKGFTADGAVIL